MTEEEFEALYGPDPKTFDRNLIMPGTGKLWSECLSEPCPITHDVFCWFSDLAPLYPACPMSTCRRHRKCMGPPIVECLDIFHPDSYPGWLIMAGMPLCVAAGWDMIRDDVLKILMK